MTMHSTDILQYFIFPFVIVFVVLLIYLGVVYQDYVNEKLQKLEKIIQDLLRSVLEFLLGIIFLVISCFFIYLGLRFIYKIIIWILE